LAVHERWLGENQRVFLELAERFDALKTRDSKFESSARSAVTESFLTFNLKLERNGQLECRKLVDFLKSDAFATDLRSVGLIGVSSESAPGAARK
jgi:hypothetical protein